MLVKNSKIIPPCDQDYEEDKVVFKHTCRAEYIIYLNYLKQLMLLIGIYLAKIYLSIVSLMRISVKYMRH
jgi:hypothetical protein